MFLMRRAGPLRDPDGHCQGCLSNWQRQLRLSILMLLTPIAEVTPKLTHYKLKNCAFLLLLLREVTP